MKVFINYLYNLIYQLLIIILPIITTPYISRILHVKGIGLYSVSYAIVNYFVLFGMIGISSYGSREISYVRDDKFKLSETFWEINILRFITMGVAIFGYIVYVSLGAPIEYKVLYYIQGITLLASLVDISWFFAGIENFKKTAIRNIVVKLVSVIAIFVLVKTKDDLVLYTFIIACSTVIGQLVLWKDLNSYIFFVNPKVNGIKYHFKRTIPLWLPSIAINIYNSLDKVMLSYLIDNTQAGLYESSQKIVKIASTITTSLAIVAAPNMANKFKNGAYEEARKMATTTFSFVSFLGFPMCFGIIAISETVVPWFYGPGFEQVTKLLLLSTWLIITLSWSSVFGTQILVATGEERKYTKAVIISLVINISSNFILIPRFEASGAIISSLVSEYFGMFIMAFYCRKKVEIGHMLLGITKYIFASIIMCALVFPIGRVVHPDILATFVQLLVGGIVYFILMIILKDKHSNLLLKKILK
jgi:O-antigen/teichoic acid export membrane protein